MNLDKLHASDIGDLLRLAAEVGELPRSETARRRHIVEYLRKLVGGTNASCREHDAESPALVTQDPHILQEPIVLPSGTLLILEIHRDAAERPFDQRDRQLVHLFTSRAAYLFACSRRAPSTSASPMIHDPRMDELPPRLRPVLRQLLAGDAEKQVALKLGLSPHTVHQYAKLLHRHFKVSSRGELLARFFADSPTGPAESGKTSTGEQANELPW
jgi:DNA-binding CsgD family transcriptional regulator